MRSNRQPVWPENKQRQLWRDPRDSFGLRYCSQCLLAMLFGRRLRHFMKLPDHWLADQRRARQAVRDFVEGARSGDIRRISATFEHLDYGEQFGGGWRRALNCGELLVRELLRLLAGKHSLAYPRFNGLDKWVVRRVGLFLVSGNSVAYLS